MKFAFHPQAEAEFNDAIEYYEEIEPGLPKAWSVIDGEIRRSLVSRFPYGVLYAEGDERIDIVAVMNLHRHPNYWKHKKE
jgi:plasmid stabilization system protein ParE